jgi:hypothetical protein
MKKKPLLFIIIPLIILLIAVAIYPFFNTGVLIKTSPSDTVITIDNEKFSGGKIIKIKPGKYIASFTAPGFSKLEKEIKVNWYGTSSEEIKLERLKMSDKVPYYFESETDLFFIDGFYNKDTGALYYEVNYTSPKLKEMATSWLKNNNINPEEVEIIYSEFGD